MFAVLHVADFPLQAVLRTERNIADNPAALFATSSKKSVVLETNAAARDAGVELGMTAPQAVARCPTLLIRTPAPSAEAEARAVLHAVAFTISPAVEDTAPGACTIDLKGLAAEKHLAAAYAAVAELTRLALTATAGIGRTPLLALYAARAATSRSGLRPDPASAVHEPPSAYDSASEAERQGKISKGQVTDLTYSPVLEATDEQKFLASLPLAAADPPPELAAVLANWGLRTIGDFTALPRDEIVRRFGAEGLALWRRATGGEPRPLRLLAPAREFTAAIEFEEHLETLEPLLFVLRRFLERLALELRAAQFVAAAIDLVLRLEDETHYTRNFRLPEPTADVEILFRALHTHVESLHTAAAIAALELRLVPTRPLVRQQGLFETGLRDPHGFAETLARVAALVGADRVGTPQLEDTHQPDRVKLLPPPAVIPPPASAPVHPPVGPPLRRFRPPLAARLEFTDGRPTFLWTERVHGAVVGQSRAYFLSGISNISVGPVRGTPGRMAVGDDRPYPRQERAPSSADNAPVAAVVPTATGWSRIEWEVALADGGLYRLVLIGDTYFVEGEYD